jgi:penicillin-binding protein 1A
MRPDWLKECGYFTEYVRGLLEDRFGKEQVMSLGLKVYTTADLGLHQDAQRAIKQGINALVQRNGYRGPLRHLDAKARTAFQTRQLGYFKKYPPRQGIPVDALVVQGEERPGARGPFRG